MSKKIFGLLVVGLLIVWTVAFAIFFEKPVHAENPVVALVEVPVEPAQAKQSINSTFFSEPRSLEIPSINKIIPVRNVGVTPEGRLDVPDNYVEAGWYKDGTVPGQRGSAIIDGHVDNGGAIAGVFKNLKNVQIGDDVYVQDEFGKKLHFKVTSSAVYGYKKVPLKQFFHQNDAKYLKVITCHGKWLPKEDTYNERLIVTAVLVEA